MKTFKAVLKPLLQRMIMNNFKKCSRQMIALRIQYALLFDQYYTSNTNLIRLVYTKIQLISQPYQ